MAAKDSLAKRAIQHLKKATGTGPRDIELPFREGFDTRDRRLPPRDLMGDVAKGIKAIRNLPDETRRRIDEAQKIKRSQKR